MSELADRIFELGGGPERDLEDLQKIANCKKVVFPENDRDLEGVLNAGLSTRRAESRFLPCACE